MLKYCFKKSWIQSTCIIAFYNIISTIDYVIFCGQYLVIQIFSSKHINSKPQLFVISIQLIFNYCHNLKFSCVWTSFLGLVTKGFVLCVYILCQHQNWTILTRNKISRKISYEYWYHIKNYVDRRKRPHMYNNLSKNSKKSF